MSRTLEPQTLFCKHPGCLGTVTWTPTERPPILRQHEGLHPAHPRDLRVYLACDNPRGAHEYPYDVIPPGVSVFAPPELRRPGRKT